MKQINSKVLVTGGAGFIGSHLCEELLGRGFYVTAVDNLSTGRIANIRHLLRHRRFRFYKGSILEKGLMQKLIKNNGLIFHLAAVVGVKLILEKTIESMSTNIAGTQIILELAARYRRKVLITSSSEVYGKPSLCLPLTEDSDRIIGPSTVSRWSYSNAKAANEFMALAYAKEKKLPVVIVRLFNTVGPRQVGHYGMVLPRFIKQAISGNPITVHGDGKQIRSFTYVKDTVKAMVDLMLNKKAEGNIFNIGSSEYVPIKVLAKMIKERTHSKSKLRYISYRDVYGEDFEDAKCRMGDIQKIRKMIKYRPRYRIAQIIDNTVEYFEKHGHGDA